MRERDRDKQSECWWEKAHTYMYTHTHIKNNACGWLWCSYLTMDSQSINVREGFLWLIRQGAS